MLQISVTFVSNHESVWIQTQMYIWLFVDCK